MIASEEYDVVVCADGSTTSDKASALGKTGCGVVIKVGETKNTLEIPLCAQSNNYEAELFGLLSGIQFVRDNGHYNKNILFLCDCLPAISSAFSWNQLSSQYNNIITQTRAMRDEVARNNNIKCTWVPGHKGFDLNEEADSCAKSAAKNAVVTKCPERSIALIRVKECSVQNSWEFRFKHSLADHFISSVVHKVGCWISRSDLPNFHVVNQLVSGHSYLNASRCRLTGGTPLCDCGELESRNHFLFHCERFARQRSEWLFRLNFILEADYSALVDIDISTVFGQSKDLSREINREIIKCMTMFIHQSSRFK